MHLDYLFKIPACTENYDISPIYLGDARYDLIPSYDTLFSYYQEKHKKESIKNPVAYQEFMQLFKPISLGTDSIYIDMEEGYMISDYSFFNIYPDSDKKIVTQTYIPGNDGKDNFIVLIRCFNEEGQLRESKSGHLKKAFSSRLIRSVFYSNESSR